MSTTTGGESVQEEDWVDLPPQQTLSLVDGEEVGTTTTAKDATDTPPTTDTNTAEETTVISTEETTSTDDATATTTMTPSASTTTKPTKKNLQASYQEIQQAKQLAQQQEKEQAEAQAEAERQAKEAERLASIQRLEVERQQKKKEQEQKAREEAKAAAAAAAIAVPSASNTTSNTTTSHADASSNSSTGAPPSSSSTSLLVLISTAFGTMEQRTNQDRAISMIQALQIPLETVDGSDPACKDRRNELFGISGLRGKYPQIFQQNGDAGVSFLGDYDGLQAMIESGELARMAPAVSASSTTGASNVPAPSAPSASSDSTPSATNGAASSSSSSLPSSMVVLVSKSFGTMEQRTQQDRAITMLQAKGIPFEEVDGSDPACKDRRNEMFGISGLRGKYPQFFTKNSDGTLSYFGDYDALQVMNETGEIANVVAPVAPPVEEAVSTEMAPPAEAKDPLIVLVSRSFGSPEQRTQQDRAITMLRAKGIPFEEVDGSDPACKDRRNELFAISGMRGKYPQFFSPAGGTLTFLGMFEAIEAMNEQGNLQTDAVHSMPSAAPTPPVTTVPEKEPVAQAPPKPATSVPARSESYQVPNETFENEFELPKGANGKPVRSESTQIPNETFENEFDAQSTDNDNLVPDDEKFENEFQPSGDEFEDDAADDEEEEPALLSRELEDMGAMPVPAGKKGGAASPAPPVDMTLVLGILAVSVIVGIWLATRR